MKTLETCALIVTTKTFHVKMEEETPVTYFFLWIFWCMTSDEHVYSRWVIFKKDSLVPKASLELWQLHKKFQNKSLVSKFKHAILKNVEHHLMAPYAKVQRRNYLQKPVYIY
jgi:hypothetical protein